MKCIHCGSDSKYKDRSSNGLRCSSCLHPFAFEPKTDPLSVSDGLFQRVVKDVSADNTLFFTEHQLWYELNRRVISKMVHVPKGFGWGAGACIAAGAAGCVLLANPVPIIIGIAGAITSIVVGTKVGKKNPAPRKIRIPFATFQSKYLQRYITAHGRLEKLLPPVIDRPNTPRGQIWSDQAPDLTSYSFDRALIVDTADIAAMLVANRFHFENNCAILSFDQRFPEGEKFSTIREMLNRNPRLIVFAIHSTTVPGLRMAFTLREPNWFPDPSVQIIDLGLRPKHAIKGGFLLTEGPTVGTTPKLAAQLEAEEVKWLSEGNIAELASLRPARLMRAIYQGFAQASQVNSDGEVVLVDTGHGVWVHNPGADVYAADSFG